MSRSKYRSKTISKRCSSPLKRPKRIGNFTKFGTPDYFSTEYFYNSRYFTETLACKKELKNDIKKIIKSRS